MTVQAKPVDPFRLFRIIGLHRMVAGHASVIFRRRGGEGGASFVTDTALFPDRPGRVKPALLFISDPGLIMGIMATNAVSIFARIFDF